MQIAAPPMTRSIMANILTSTSHNKFPLHHVPVSDPHSRALTTRNTLAMSNATSRVTMGKFLLRVCATIGGMSRIALLLNKTTKTAAAG